MKKQDDFKLSEQFEIFTREKQTTIEWKLFNSIQFILFHKSIFGNIAFRYRMSQ
jgi:hypothetical protein